MGGLAIIAAPTLFSFKDANYTKVTILHTNDTHSHIDPFPADHSKFANRGGAQNRFNLIQKIRSEEKNVLLLDAGDIFQGTQYFNMFGGERELTLMSKVGYDAGTMGNHDFDNGLEGFDRVKHHANFPFICSNYNFDDTILNGFTEPYKIFKIDGVRIGVFAVGVELDGLVSKKNYKETQYLNPVKTAQKYADFLRNEKKCELVICLSHLGYDYETSKIGDVALAKNTNNIDLIIGGHTHTFLDKPQSHPNKDGKMTLINQVGWAGLNVGRIDFYFGDIDETSAMHSSISVH
jgi:5'-nucleotidase